MSPELLAPVCVDWLARAGLSVRYTGSVAELLEFGVQPRFAFDTSADPIVVESIPERRPARVRVLEGEQLQDVERWAVLLVASDARRRAGLADGGGPPTDRSAGGFQLVTEGTDLVVVDPAGVRRLRFVDGVAVPWDARGFTHAADLPLDEIVGRLESDAGW